LYELEPEAGGIATVTRHPKSAATVGVLSLAAAIVGIASAAAAPGAPAHDATAALIRRRTEVFSDASARNDATAMNDMLDDDVLFSNGNGDIQRDPQRDKADSVSALLKRRTQAFIDAGRRGDTAAVARYLDRDVLFVNEAGALLGRRDATRAAPAATPKGARVTVTLTDWRLRHAGDMAVASFTEDQTLRHGGQVVDDTSITVETWIRRGASWKLLASQTVRKHRDPPTTILPADALNDYVGAYSAGAGANVIISRDGDALTSSRNGAKPVPLAAEARDIFFASGEAPGYPRQRFTFQRDASGRVTGLVSRIRGAGDLVAAKVDSAGAQGESVAAGPVIPPTLILRDFVARHVGDIVVATFLHDKVTHIGAVTLHTTFRSSETWFRRGGAWKIIASQGRELQPDPPAKPLSPG
jgi:ketosteroid isomerase-like protein